MKSLFFNIPGIGVGETSSITNTYVLLKEQNVNTSGGIVQIKGATLNDQGLYLSVVTKGKIITKDDFKFIDKSGKKLDFDIEFFSTSDRGWEGKFGISFRKMKLNITPDVDIIAI